MKKIITILLTMVVMAVSAVSVSASSSDMIDKYITIGTCNGTPVTYRIWGTRDVDGDGQDELFLAPEEVLFPSAYNTVSASSWEFSSLRKYLNNAETGFLSGFSNEEIALIVPVTQKTLYGQAAGSAGGNGYFLNNAGGVSHWTYSNGFNNAWQEAEAADYKYDNAYYLLTTDMVFIPSIKDSYEYQINPGTYKSGNAATSGLSSVPASYSIWFRDNQAGTNMWRYDTSDDKIKTVPAPTYDSLWVRPAFYIKSDIEVRGNGTKSEPYKISKGIDPDYTITQNGRPVSDVLGEGTVNIGGNIWLNLEDDTYILRASVTEVVDGAETMVDYKEQILYNQTENTLNLSLDNCNSNCYLLISVCDDTGAPVNEMVVCGKKSAIQPANRIVNTFGVDATVSENAITVKGDVPEEYGKSVAVRIVKKNNEDIIAYSSQVEVPDTRSFNLTVNIDNLFGGTAERTGWYKIYLTSASGIADTDAGLAGEEMYNNIITMFNDGKWDEIKKIFSKDEQYLLEYYAVSGRGFYEEEYLTDIQILEYALEQMSLNKPENGWTKENIVDYFNKYVTFAYFDASDAEKKLEICVDSKYSDYLGTTEIAKEDYFKTLAENKETTLFDGLNHENVGDKLEEKVILVYITKAENSEQVREIVENKADKAGIVFETAYDNFTEKQLKTLYDQLLGVKFEDLSALKSAFDKAYKKAFETTQIVTPKPSSGGSGSGSGGGSRKNTTISSSVPQSTPIVVPEQNGSALLLADIDSLTWGREAIEALYQKGVISGDENGKFRPDDMITREEMSKLLAVSFNLKSGNSLSFEDVSKDSWYYEYIAALTSNGITRGVNDRMYGVGEYLTREDMAVMLYRLLDINEEDCSKAFADSDKISEYAVTAVNSLCNMGIINGYDDNSFKPYNHITRQEAAVLIYRATGGKN